LVDTADRIFGELGKIEEKMLELKGLLGGKIRISAVSTGKYIIPYLMADFMKIHPHVEFSLEVSNTVQGIGSLARKFNRFGFGFPMARRSRLGKYTTSMRTSGFWQALPKIKKFTPLMSKQATGGKYPFYFEKKVQAHRTMMERFFQDRDIHVESNPRVCYQ